MATTTSVPTPRQVDAARAGLLDLHAAAVTALVDLLVAARQVDADMTATLVDAARRTRAGESLDEGTFTGIPDGLNRGQWMIELPGRPTIRVGDHFAARLAEGALANALTAARVHPSGAGHLGLLITERIADWARP